MAAESTTQFRIWRLRKRVYLMSFWHFTLRIRKKQYRLWVVKVKFHVFTCSKNMKSALSSFSPGSHLRIDQLNFRPYSVKLAKTCRRGQGKSLWSFHHLRPYTDHNQICILWILWTRIKRGRLRKYAAYDWSFPFLICKSSVYRPISVVFFISAGKSYCFF